jgi:hypothetical protein
MGRHLIRELRRYPLVPRITTLEDVRPDEWVHLKSVTLDCSSLVQIGRHDYVLGRSAGGREVVVMFGYRVDCGEPAAQRLRGVIEPLTSQLANAIKYTRLRVRADDAAQLCTYCGPTNDRVGVVVVAVGAAAGVVLIGRGVRLRRSRPS